MAGIEYLLEAERRGILPPEKQALLDEARRRGQVKDGRQPGEGFFLKASDPVYKFMAGMGRELAQGLLFGAGEEYGAATKSVETGRSYEGLLAEERSAQETFREKHPYASIAANIVGGVPTGFGLAKAGAAVARKVAPKVLQKVPNYLKAIGAGAGVGGAYGFGAGEGGFGERVESAGIGAGLGAGTGAVAYPLIRGGQMVYDKGRQLWQGRFAPKRAAKEVFAQAMVRDETTPGRIKARLQELGPQATIADAGGENLLGAARAAASVPGKTKNRATMLLDQRAEREVADIGVKIKQTLGPTDYHVAEDKFLNNLFERAKPLYERAYKAGKQIISPKLESILKRPVMKKAMKEAAELAGIAGRRLAPLHPPLTAQANLAIEAGKAGRKAIPKGGIAKGVSTEAIDDLKRGLDSMIDKETNALTGYLTKRGRAIKNLKNQMLREVDRLNPAYAKARKAYSGDAEVLEALREGRNFLKRDPEVIGKMLAGMSDAAKKAYRSGAARSLMDVVEKTPDMASAARRISGNTLIRRKLRAVMPDQKSYRELIRTLTAKKRFTQTRGKILGGSPTQPRLAEQADLERSLGNIGAIVGSELPIGGHALVKAGIGRKIAAGAARVVPERSAELSRTLLNRNPAMNQGALEEIARSYGIEAARAAGNSLIERMITRALAQQAGQRGPPAIASYRR